MPSYDAAYRAQLEAQREAMKAHAEMMKTETIEEFKKRLADAYDQGYSYGSEGYTPEGISISEQPLDFHTRHSFTAGIVDGHRKFARIVAAVKVQALAGTVVPAPDSGRRR